MVINKTMFWILLFVPLFIQARVANQIKIMKTGAYDSGDRAEYEKEGCKTFNPTKEQLVHYFSKAKESDSNSQWIHEYYSPCVASGTITFNDGSSGSGGYIPVGLDG